MRFSRLAIGSAISLLLSLSLAAAQSPAGKFVVTGFVMLAAGLLALGLLRLVFREKADLHAALKPYSDDEPVDENDATAVNLVETGFVRRAVDKTAQIAEERGVLEVIEQRLEQADLPLRATLVIDPPTATSGECAEATLTCAFTASSLLCK